MLRERWDLRNISGRVCRRGYAAGCGEGRERPQRGEACHRCSSWFLSPCSVILESDPQQVIQKVNFRVSLPTCPLTRISSRLPFPSSLHMGLPGLRQWEPRLL